MDFEILKKDILRTILSTEEGKQELMDFAKGKIRSAKSILDKYSEIFFQRTGRRIDFYDKHLADRAEILLRKELPHLYDGWKDNGFGNMPSIQEESLIAVKTLERQENESKFDKNHEIISEQMHESIKVTKLNDFVARKITDGIVNAIQSSKYYTDRLIGMDYRNDDMMADLTFEVRKLIASVRPEDVEEILDKAEKMILSKIDKTVQKNIEERKFKQRKDSEVKESTETEGKVKQQDRESEFKDDEEKFREELKVDVNYSEVLDKFSDVERELKESSKDTGKEEQDKSNKIDKAKENKTLSTEFII